MTKKEIEVVANSIGHAQGEVAAAFFGVLNVMIKSQPIFNYESFTKGISSLLKNPNATEFQKDIWKKFIY